MLKWGSQQGWRQPLFSDSGAPRGYGQQNGASPFLDRSRQAVEGALQEIPDTGWSPYGTEPSQGSSGWMSHIRTGNERETSDMPTSTPPPTPPASTTTASTSTSNPYGAYGSAEGLRAAQAAWDEEYRRLQPGQYMNRQRPGSEFSADPREGAPPESGLGAGGANNPAYPPPPPPTGATASGANDLAWRKSLTYGNGPGVLRGFNVSGAGYDDKAANSVKNTFGRIAQRYPATPEGLKQLVNDPDFKRAFPNAKLVEGGAGDKIDFGGILSDFESGTPVGVIDVGQGFNPTGNTGSAWWWGSDPSTGAGSSAGGSASPAAVTGALDPNMQQTVGLPRGSITPEMLMQILNAPTQYGAYF